MTFPSFSNTYLASKIFVVFLVCSGLSLYSQSADEQLFRVAFYNLENLFHPDDDSLTKDEEFTPTGDRHWSHYRYQNKVNQMAKAILSIGEWEPPAIVGLEEVENRQVVNDLLASPVLQKIPYRVVHYESEDRRGIDVALIYRLDRFRLIYSSKLRLFNSQQPNYRTRDILYIKGIADERDTLHLFVCHWPSRYGGQAISEPKRMAVSSMLKTFIDSLQMAHNGPNIIIGGDFNDEPQNQSLQFLCDTGTSGIRARSLINLMAKLDPSQGSNRHHGIWTYLDQIIVSDNLMNDQSPMINSKKANVHRAGFLLEQDPKYPGDKPFRHFLGLRHHGGFSDHLPVYIDLILADSVTKLEN